MSLNLVRADPPMAESRGRRVRPEEVEAAAKIREEPNVWFSVFEFEGEKAPFQAGGLAATIRRGERAAFRPNFTALSRTTDGVSRVYVRYEL